MSFNLPLQATPSHCIRLGNHYVSPPQHITAFTSSLNSTSSSSKSDFSAPWMQADLLNTETYVALPNFLSRLVWSKAGSQNDLMYVPSDKDTPQYSSQATCAIVGTMSPVQLFLEPHGNFNPLFENSTLETSKAQFQLVSPALQPEFNNDFKVRIEHIKSLHNKAIMEGPNTEHFVVLDGQRKALKFSWPLFEKRVCILPSLKGHLYANNKLNLGLQRPSNITVGNFFIPPSAALPHNLQIHMTRIGWMATQFQKDTGNHSTGLCLDGM